MTKPFYMVTDPNLRPIKGNFTHCKKCLAPVLKKGITYTQQLEVLLSEDGGTIQVRCAIHNCNVVTVSSSLIGD